CVIVLPPKARRSAIGAAPRKATAKKFFKEIRILARVIITVVVEIIALERILSRSSGIRTAILLLRLFILFTMLPIFAILIVFLTLVRIGQHFVGLIDFLKFLLSLLVIWIQIRMKLAGKFSICFFDVLLAGCFIQS